MANTVHGPFTPGASTTTGSYGTGAGQVNTYTSGNANNDETQASVALASFNPDLVTAAFILSGVACVKDATTASQLNVTSGEAYLLMSDGTYARIDVAATSFSTTGETSTTVYLFLNRDGSWAWQLSSTGATGALPICQVTTDGSANIATVTDKRVTLASLLSGAAHTSVTQPGGVSLPGPLSVETTQAALLAGTVTGGVTFGGVGALRGSMDGAATFDGTSGYLTLPTTSLPTGNAAWSLEGWFKTSTSAANQMIVSLGGTATKTAALLYVNSSNQLTADLFSASISSTATVTDGAWHHAAATWDGTTLTLYLDGASVASSATVGPDAIAYGTALIGAQNYGSLGNFFHGALDEVAIYGAALSSTRVSAHYSAGTSTTSDGYAAAVLADAPLRYYRLGDASGASVAADTTSPMASVVMDAAGALGGALLVDSEGGQTVMRTAPVANPLVIQVNGHNTTFGAGGNLTLSGAVASVGGQTSVGNFGAPVIVAQALAQHITATTFGTVLSFAAPADGLYRCSLHASVGATGGAVEANINYTEANLSLGTSRAYFTWLGNPNTLLNGTTTITSQAVATQPITCYVKGGTSLLINYGNLSGTPNDYVSAMIERLS